MADTARIQLKPSFSADDFDTLEGLTLHGGEFSGWSEIPYLEPETCAHETTICRDCQESWECDWIVEMPTYGPL